MVPRLSCPAVALALVLSANAFAQTPTPAGTPTTKLPDTPAGRVIADWMDAFNSGDSIKLVAYYQKYGVQRDMAVQMDRRRRSGGFDLVSVERSQPRMIETVFRERVTGNLAYGVLELSPDGVPVTLKQSLLMAVPPGGSVADFKVDAATRARGIDGANAKLNEYYVFPDVAAKMASTVRARNASGAYDHITNGPMLAQLLTDEFQGVSKDKHLRVNFSAPRMPDRPANPVPDSAMQARYRQDMERVNCGFEKAEVMANNIGYLKFNFFADPEVCGPIASREMTKLADVDALIIDLRENGGGSPGMVAHVSSYLFSKRVHLNDLWTRRTNETNEFWTRPDVPGKKVKDNVPVYVLTASRTFSGAEEFSYNLKNLKRATIIGETTGGGAHPVSGHKIDDHYGIGVPFARAINPYSKTNWEGTGVAPDVKVPAAEAMTTALRMISERRPVP
jgi:retinol-binding protein 3